MGCLVLEHLPFIYASCQCCIMWFFFFFFFFANAFTHIVRFSPSTLVSSYMQQTWLLLMKFCDIILVLICEGVSVATWWAMWLSRSGTLHRVLRVDTCTCWALQDPIIILELWLSNSDCMTAGHPRTTASMKLINNNLVHIFVHTDRFTAVVCNSL